jgi:hypothetical protein
VTDDGLQQIAEAIRRASEDVRPRDDCPTAERIWGAVQLELGLAERLEIIDHTTECLACAEAWRIAMTLVDRSASAHQHAERPRWSWKMTGTRAAAALVLAVAGLGFLLMNFEMRYGEPVFDQNTAQSTPATPPRPHASSPNLPPNARPTGSQTAQTSRGTQTQPNASSSDLVSLKDGGGSVTLTADGKLTTNSELDKAKLELVKQALLTRRLARSSTLHEVKTSAGTLMGGATSQRFRVVSPIGTMVEDDRPTLEWTALEGASGYEATISDVGANYRVAVTSPRVKETTWRVPAPLSRGRTYSWQVVAFTASGQLKAPSSEQAEARFRVISGREADAVAKARVAHKGEHLVLGLTYAAHGLLDEAEREFRALATANPHSSVVEDLSRSLREMRNGQR